MRYQFQFRHYRRSFRQPVITHHGVWAVREGIILRLTHEAGRVGWGEVAPIPWFGSETVEEALAFCYQLPSVLTDDYIFSIPDTLPACQFGFECAWEGVGGWAISKGKPQRRGGAEGGVAFGVGGWVNRFKDDRSEPQRRGGAEDGGAFGVGGWICGLQNDKSEPQRRRDAEDGGAFGVGGWICGLQGSNGAVQNSIVSVQDANVAALSSNVAVQNSNVAAPSSNVAVQNLNVAVLNSNVAAPSSNVAVQNSNDAALSSNVAVQNSNDAALNPNVAVLNSNDAVQTSNGVVPGSNDAVLHSYSALLPAGEAAFHVWRPLWEQGFRTFKWKLGVRTIAQELESLNNLAGHLPATAKLRLDANGGLSFGDAARWLEACDAIAANPSLPVEIEYLEQPLHASEFQAMQALTQRYRTPIALDESVATLQQLEACYENGWRSVFVIKPAIVGSPSRLRQFCQKHAIDAVFSSAFETAIGRQAGLRLAAELANPGRALGYGTTHWFDNAELSDPDQLWQTL